MAKRIVFSNDTPNDKCFITPNNTIDFTRFNKNPVALKEHNWQADPIGIWTDLKEIDGNWTGIPVFHGLTEESKITKELYEGGWIKSASIGGEAIFKKDAVGRDIIDKNGNKICEIFYLYEISIVTLPSNEDAVTLSAMNYENDAPLKSIQTLNSKFTQMTKPTETQTLAANPDSVLPGWLQKIIGLGGKVTFSGAASEPPAPQGLPLQMQPKNPDIAPQPKPIGLAAKMEAAKKKLETVFEEAKAAKEKMEEMKAKAEAENASAEDKKAFQEAEAEYNSASAKFEKAEAKVKKIEEAAAAKAAAEEGEEEEDEDDDLAAKPKNKVTLAATGPKFKTVEQMKNELKLAATPQHTAKVHNLAGGKTFSQLAASKDASDMRLMGRVLAKDAGGKDIADYAAVLNSILADGKFAALASKARINTNVTESQMQAYKSNPNSRGAGLTLAHLAAQLERGEISCMARGGGMKNITALSSSDDALASPALNAIEWMSMAIFKLFPTTSWKNEIAIFPAEMTGRNTGIIWANIAADPEVYKGNQPSNPTNYQYSDDAVSLALTPYWLQPMLWNPLTMHQLRYDQMGTGWAQAFAKWNSIIDDNLIFTLASTVPAGSILKTTGKSGYETQAQTFNISGPNDPNSFYYNPSFSGSLVNPVLNDVIGLEQVYNRQNFDLSVEKPTLITDPTMQALFDKDPETKSLLTRWVNAEGGEFVKFKHTIFSQRSRVAIFDPATGQVKDPNGTIPSTAISAGVGFIPSQVGMGLGMLDVFMIQDPSSYGYKMSADIRMGIVPLRKNFNGTTLLTYSSPNV